MAAHTTKVPQKRGCLRKRGRVVVGDIADEAGGAVEAVIKAARVDAHYRHLDVTSADEWQAEVDFAVATFGKLDILINNSAILLPRVPIEERTEEDWVRYGGEREGDVPRHESGDSGNAGCRLKVDRLYFFNRRDWSGDDTGTCICCKQSRDACLQQGDRRATREGQYAVQFSASGPGRHSDVPRGLSDTCSSRSTSVSGADAACSIWRQMNQAM